MEPLNDDQLKEVLQEWRVPVTPAYLEARVFAPRKSFWRWLLTTSIPIPVPVFMLALLAILAIVYSLRTQPASVDLSGFQPVKQLNLRVIRSNQ